MSSSADSSGPKPKGPADSHSASSAETPAAVARRVLRAADRATLATLLCDPGPSDGGPSDRGALGWPYPSLVLTALDHDGSPLLLISRLADHTRNILADSRVGLLFDGTAGLDHPLAGARVSVLGRAAPSADERHRARYLARHPGASMYAGFADFAIYKVTVERAHLVAGFGRIHWIDAADLLLPAVSPGLAADEAGLIRHMNEREQDAVQLFAGILLGLPGQGGWTVTGIDPEGVDLRCGGAVGRLDFDHRVHDGESAKAELIRLAARARRRFQEAADAGSPFAHG